jgi:uncharacterized Zn-finger protein
MADVPEITLDRTARVWCDGAGQIRGGAGYRPAALGHPRVYLQIDESGYVDCGYCDRGSCSRRSGRRRDQSALRDISAGSSLDSAAVRLPR